MDEYVVTVARQRQVAFRIEDAPGGKRRVVPEEANQWNT